MKGSLARGFTLTEDKIRQDLLKADKKIIAENLMIVDLLRNDLGRIAEKVWVPKLFTAEKYRTIHQMTSTIAAKLKENISLKSLFTALFPSGSVTGAPKIKTMQIINRLEKEPRGIYTGAIGYISPEKSACFNVAIRTAAIRDDKGEMGIGGGIVYDSNPRQEYEEALLKAKFLREQFYNFELIETILWQNQRGYFLLALHLNRLKKSCDYFSIKLDFEKLNKELTVLENKLKSTNANSKVRVLVGLEGGIKLESSALGKIEVPVKIKISPKRINPNDPFLYHKTTKRELYEEELAKAKKEGFFEVIFQNLHSEITEGSITNIFILKNSMFYTPPVKCGLLPGVLREHLFITGKAKEKLLYRADIFGADKVYIGNSVRGLCEAQI
jgi:para-aminobenzoate synthetase/4-amino-4-deoxychorismate lyase